MEKSKTYKIWTKHGHFTLFCMVLHQFTTANTFCAKGSPHLLVPPYCKFCCTAKLSFVASFLRWCHEHSKKKTQRCHLWRILDEGWFLPHFDYGSSFFLKIYMAYKWELLTTSWDGLLQVAFQGFGQKVIMWQTSQHAWEKGPWLFGVYRCI